MEKYLEIYKKNGVVIIPNVFTEKECDKIKEESYSIQDDDIKKAGYPHNPSETSKNKKSLIFFPSLANDYLNEIRTDNRIVKIVKFFLGDNVKQINNQIYFRESGDLDEFAWHQDIIFREKNNFKSDIDKNYLQTIICVDDIDEDNGAIEFIDGSHINGLINPPDNLRNFDRMGLIGKKYIAKKGDMLLWSSLTIHGSEKNISTKSRMTYMNGFSTSDSSLMYPNYLIDGNIIKKIDTKLIP